MIFLSPDEDAKRNGEVISKVVNDTCAYTLHPFICDNVKRGSELMTDDNRSYNRISLQGYTHKVINHSSKQYVNGTIHTNTIEGFWSQLKRSINGTYHAVSPKYLQNYLNEFVYRYNLRHSETHLFHLIVPTAGQPVL